MMMKAPAMYAISPFFGLVAMEYPDDVAPSMTEELPLQPLYDMPIMRSI